MNPLSIFLSIIKFILNNPHTIIQVLHMNTFIQLSLFWYLYNVSRSIYICNDRYIILRLRQNNEIDFFKLYLFFLFFFSLNLIDSGKDFAVQDISWFSSLEGTKWLTCVSQCLKVACDAAKHLENHTVIIKGLTYPSTYYT